MLGNWIKQTTTSTGTGNLTLAAVTGFPQFTDQFATTDYFYYTILNDADGTPIESGIGHLSSSTLLVRDRPLATFVSGTYSDADPTAATLAAGTKRVICSMEQGAVQANPINLNSTFKALYASHQIVPVSGTNSTALLNRPLYIPIIISSPRTIDAVLFRVSVAASAGGVVKGGIYSSTLSGDPGAKIVESATVATTTAATVVACTFTKRRFKPGLYYIALIFDVAAPNFSNPNPTGFINPVLCDTNMFAGIAGRYEVSTGSTLPSTATPIANQDISQVPLVAVRMA